MLIDRHKHYRTLGIGPFLLVFWISDQSLARLDWNSESARSKWV